MEKIDPKAARQVWNRVQAAPAPSQDAQILVQMLQSAAEDASVYQLLARSTAERLRPELRKLYLQTMSHIACLKGVHILLTGTQPTLPETHPQKEPAQIALRRCYGRQTQRLSLRRGELLVLGSDGLGENEVLRCCMDAADSTPGELATRLLTCAQLGGQDDATVATVSLEPAVVPA